MILIKMQQLLSCFRGFLEGKLPFSSLRDFVFQFYEGDRDVELDVFLKQVFPLILPYLQWEEAMGDPKREIRIRRLFNLLQKQQTFLPERVLFALEFDKIIELTKKENAGIIPSKVYHEQMAKLSSCSYDIRLIEKWGKQHLAEQEPVIEKLK